MLSMVQTLILTQLDMFDTWIDKHTCKGEYISNKRLAYSHISVITIIYKQVSQYLFIVYFLLLFYFCQVNIIYKHIFSRKVAVGIDSYRRHRFNNIKYKLTISHYMHEQFNSSTWGNLIYLFSVCRVVYTGKSCSKDMSLSVSSMQPTVSQGMCSILIRQLLRQAICKQYNKITYYIYRL